MLWRVPKLVPYLQKVGVPCRMYIPGFHDSKAISYCIYINISIVLYLLGVTNFYRNIRNLSCSNPLIQLIFQKTSLASYWLLFFGTHHQEITTKHALIKNISNINIEDISDITGPFDMVISKMYQFRKCRRAQLQLIYRSPPSTSIMKTSNIH
jgi:hypothetical protein